MINVKRLIATVEVSKNVMENMLIIKEKCLYAMKIMINVKRNRLRNFIKKCAIQWLDIHIRKNNVKNVFLMISIGNDNYNIK